MGRLYRTVTRCYTKVSSKIVMGLRRLIFIIVAVILHVGLITAQPIPRSELALQSPPSVSLTTEVKVSLRLVVIMRTESPLIGGVVDNTEEVKALPLIA